MVLSAMLEMWAAPAASGIDFPFGRRVRTRRSVLHAARLLLASVLGLLLPWPGTVVLLGGECLLVFRLSRRSDENSERSARGGRQVFGWPLRSGDWPDSDSIYIDPARQGR
jgi:hypothetical protein